MSINVIISKIWSAHSIKTAEKTVVKVEHIQPQKMPQERAASAHETYILVSNLKVQC